MNDLEFLLKLQADLAEHLKKPPIVSVEDKPYDYPEMTVDSPDLIVDGHTPNKDGSIWAMTPVIPGRDPGGPKRMVYGYISPKKNPDLWELAKAIYPSDFKERFEDPWKEDPYMLYIGNPASLLDRGYAWPGKGNGHGEINFMLFTYSLKPFKSHRP